jgi:S1-C subfamily serine protease
LVLVVAGALLVAFVPGLYLQERVGSGTGFVIGEAGYILTAAHVVRGARQVTVEWAGRRYRAAVVATTADHDLAVVAVAGARPMPRAVLGNSDFVHIGDEVTAIGYPEGRAWPTALTTEVLGVGWRAIGPEDAVLTDLLAVRDPFRAGYSGAPLVNASGEVVGVVAGNLSTGGGQEAGFAVSVNLARVWLAGRGISLPPVASSQGVALSPAEVVQAVQRSVVRIEVQVPRG